MYTLKYKKSILVFIAFFMCFSMLLKHSIDYAEQSNDIAAVFDAYESINDVDEVSSDAGSDFLFEANDDFMLPQIILSCEKLFFLLDRFLHITYHSPENPKFLRPPSI
jgi:hypothetical protein